MKFGPVAPDDAIGGVTVHTIRKDSLVLKKGTTVGAAEADALRRAGVNEIVVARLDEGDVSEDSAAASIAQAVAGAGVTVERAVTGRANLFAADGGVLVVDRDAVDRINRVDEAITLATLPAFKAVVAGEMIGTVKIIPFGVAGQLRDAAVAAVSPDTLRVVPYTVKSVGVVSTTLPGLAPKVIDKTLRVTAERLAPTGARIIAERRVAHDEAELADAIRELIALKAELVIVFGASAIADRRDVIPAAIEKIGGHIEHFGMPVDPGNLLLIGNVDNVHVLGAPGCARSPTENGFDWVLMRLLAGLKVSRADITGLGVGGLLMEIVTRPQPRVPPGTDGNRKVAAIVLAAGRSTRMGGPNKLLGRAWRQAAGAYRCRTGAVVEGIVCRRRDGTSGGTGQASTRRAECDFRAQRRFCRWAGDISEGRHRGRAARCGWRGGLSRRHAIDRCRAHRPADRCICAGPWRVDRNARQRWTAWQSGAVVTPLLRRTHDP